MALSRSYVASDPFNVYYNMSLYNDNDYPVVANFNESRITPLLLDPSRYYMSVIRFSVPGDLIPIFVAQALRYPNTNVNNLIYTVTLTRNGTTSGPIPVVWVPPNTLTPQVPLFTLSSPSQYPTDPYYFCYSYQCWLDMINTALAAAYTALPDKGSTSQPPYLTLDPLSGIVSLFAQQSYFVSTGSIDNVQVWFNTALYHFFPSFQYLFNSYTPSVVGQNYSLLIKDNLNNIPSSPSDYYQMSQEYSSLFSWNDLQSISIRSGSIPVVSENITGLAKMGQSLTSGNSNNQIAYITDFEPYNDSSSAAVFRQTIQYLPTAEYRLTDLTSNRALFNIDCQYYWNDFRGTTYPLMIPPHNDLTAKILFRLKSFYE